MSSNQESLDQAEKLRSKVGHKDMDLEPIITEEDQHLDSVDGLQLPPRSEVHRKKENQKTKIRIRYPIVRLLAITFILIVIIVASYNLWKDNNSVKSDATATDDTTIDIYEIKDNEPVIKDEFIIAKPEESEPEQTESLEDEANVENDVEHIEEINKEQELPPAVQNETTPEKDETIHESKEDINKNNEKMVYHKVQANETLYRVSMKYFNSRAGEDIIKKANGLDANGTIITGQVLKIPMKTN